MVELVVDSMNKAADWVALAPDGLTASTQLAMADDKTLARFGADRTSARITGTNAAAGHMLRRSLSALDLSRIDELRLWIHGDRTADGSDARPYFLEVRLGSAAMGVADPANFWQRYLPLTRAGTWESARLDLRDLHPSVRSALNILQLRCVDASAPFTWYVDDLLAVRDEMLGDVEAALVARLDKRIKVSGKDVPAVVAVADALPAATKPFILIRHYDLRFSDARTNASRPTGDSSDGGYSRRAPSFAYDLYYQVEAWGDDRTSETQIVEFVLRELPPRGELVAAGVPLPMDGGLAFPAPELIGGARTGRVPIFYKIATRQEVGVPQPVKAVRAVGINIDTST